MFDSPNNPWEGDYVGRDTNGQKEFSETGRPNQEALEEQRDKYVNEAIEKVFAKEENKKTINQILNNYSDPVEFSNQLDSFVDIIVEQLKKDYNLTGENEEKEVEFRAAHSPETIKFLLKRKLFSDYSPDIDLKS